MSWRGQSEGYSNMARSMSATRFMQTPYIPAPIAQTHRNTEIPGYATGQVIPTSMKKHFAILGDNNHETEVVSPLSSIKQANRESLLEVLSELGLIGRNENKNGNIYNIKALTNSKVLFELMIEEGKMQQMSTGNNPFSLGCI